MGNWWICQSCDRSWDNSHRTCPVCGPDPALTYPLAGRPEDLAEIERLRNKLNKDSQNFQIECQKAEIAILKDREMLLKSLLERCSVFLQPHQGHPTRLMSEVNEALTPRIAQSTPEVKHD